MDIKSLGILAVIIAVFAWLFYASVTSPEPVSTINNSSVNNSNSQYDAYYKNLFAHPVNTPSQNMLADIGKLMKLWNVTEMNGTALGRCDLKNLSSTSYSIVCVQ